MIRAALGISFGAVVGVIVFTGVLVCIWIEAVKIYDRQDK
jgi:hypothetical protein